MDPRDVGGADSQSRAGRGRPRPRHPAAGAVAEASAGNVAGEPRTWPSAPQPRNLWPFGIIAAFAVFIAATITLIVLSTLQRDDLVTADYYARELRYEEQLESAERTRHVRDQIHVTHDAATQQIAVTLPPQHASQRPTGVIQLYRPSAADQDREIPLDTDLTGHQNLDARNLGPGLWRVRVRWTVDGDDYAVDERIVIPKRL